MKKVDEKVNLVLEVIRLLEKRAVRQGWSEILHRISFKSVAMDVVDMFEKRQHEANLEAIQETRAEVATEIRARLKERSDGMCQEELESICERLESGSPQSK